MDPQNSSVRLIAMTRDEYEKEDEPLLHAPRHMNSCVFLHPQSCFL